MSHHEVQKMGRRRRSWWWWIGLAAVATGLVAGARFVHPFLAVNQPVDADVLVVEGWVPPYVLSGAVREIKRGHYTRVLISGLEFEKGDRNRDEGSHAVRAARYLAAQGVAESLIEPCPAAPTEWNRTSQMTRAVRDRLRALGLTPKGVNVVTLGPHARQTLLAYRRILDSGCPIGVISIPKNDYDPACWWASVAGVEKTTKDFAAWVKEYLFGYRA